MICVGTATHLQINSTYAYYVTVSCLNVPSSPRFPMALQTFAACRPQCTEALAIEAALGVHLWAPDLTFLPTTVG
jgi:hypothetical protein